MSQVRRANDKQPGRQSAGFAEVGQVLRIRDKLRGEGKGLAEEGQYRRVNDKPCGEGTGPVQEGLIRRVGDKKEKILQRKDSLEAG
jgi:hypothetical protein